MSPTMLRSKRLLPSLRSLRLSGTTLMTLVAFAFGAVTISAAQTESVIHRFTRTATDGGIPATGLIGDSAGNLYGTTVRGGASDEGTVFELSPPAVSGGAWTQNILYSFTGLTDGAQPQGGLIFDGAGNLYGTTFYGGDPNFGTGVVYQLSPPAVSGASWTETVLWAFDSGTGLDGANPAGNLVFDKAGNLYGVTTGGGAGSLYCGEAGCGIVFQLKPPSTPGGAWTETDIYNFFSVGTTDGFGPNGILVTSGGVLYGTTSYGGSNGVGTFFKLMPPSSGSVWTEKILYDFSATGTNGTFPSALVQGKKGVFYGVTGLGGTAKLGTVFELTPPSAGSGWSESTLYSFAGGSDGANPGAALALDGSGNLYGTTTNGGGSTACGRSTGCGSAFRLSPPTVSGGSWTETVLHAFTGGHDGFSPSLGALLLKHGILFGTTEGGGTVANYGTVYRIVP